MSGTRKAYCGVHIYDAPYSLDKSYDYYIPQELSREVLRGTFVVVPFGGGNRKRVAVVWELKDAPSVENVKPVDRLYEFGARVGETQLELAMHMRHTLLCPLGDAIRAIMPSGARLALERTYRLEGELDEVRIAPYGGTALLVLSRIAALGEAGASELTEEFGDSVGAILTSLKKSGLISESERHRRGVSERTEAIISLSVPPDEFGEHFSGSKALTEKQSLAVEYLADNGPTSLGALISEAGVSDSVIKTLAKNGVVNIIRQKIVRDRYEALNALPCPEYDLSREQREVYERLRGIADSGEAKAAYLYGVTGSGKTFVMLELVRHVVASGRQAIVLVPEISLTMQTITLFKAQFGERALLYHSALSDGERHDAWQLAQTGEADVVIGTRSAVFAPFENLGLIIIDEEQEHTYKSDQSPRYHARDIARFRCAKSNAMLLLASATPLVESYHKAVGGVYELLTLPNRYGEARPPSITVADMGGEDGEGKVNGLSVMLINEVAAALERGEQAVILRNRRGYHHFLSCRSCRHVIACPNCSVSMKLHTNETYGGRKREPNLLICHYCGHSAALPSKCPACGGEHLARMGAGTQKCEDDLAAVFPGAVIARMDADTTATKASHDRIISDVVEGRTDILVGTQMVAKGHNFGDVTVVGVQSADQTLYMDDYRANERAFAMLIQAAGRAGRDGRPGKAIVQTWYPEHSVIRMAGEGDYPAFYEREIAFRKSCVFPPFCDLCLIMISGPIESEVALVANNTGHELERLLAEYGDVKMAVLGPMRAVVYKISNSYRMRYILKCKNNKRTRELLGELLTNIQKKLPKTMHITVDINPNNI